MFTGLIADLGTVTAVDATPDGVRLAVTSRLAGELSEGDSVAVNGVCLTATSVSPGCFAADVMRESLRRSSLAGVRDDGFARMVTIAAPAGLLRYVVEKGSIAVDGVSLTVVSVTDDAFSVSLIPETLERTNLGAARPGQTVNLEVDVLAKYVEKLVRVPA